ncbi:MAG: ThuA domain-containing protein [Holophagales bacterium]|nr:ThuA domain-containing protein [Holophagales bacterium]
MDQHLRRESRRPTPYLWVRGSSDPHQARCREAASPCGGNFLRMIHAASLTRPLLLALALLLAAAPTLAFNSEADEPVRVLFVSKSSGFQHSAIKRTDGHPSHVDTVLAQVATERGFEITSTKDAGLINATQLASFDVVIFYTTGDLTQRGGAGEGIFRGDGNPPMSADGVSDLIAWIEAGGGFVGFHPATDTFHGENDEVTPYIGMIGGEFTHHGRQFPGIVRVADARHPTMKAVEDGWKIMDEWYLFKNVAEDKLHVLALMDPGEERANQEVYDIAPYPIAWCRELGAGRVLYNAMGHREDVWDHEMFQAWVGDTIEWAAGEGEAAAAPNWGDVVP